MRKKKGVDLVNIDPRHPKVLDQPNKTLRGLKNTSNFFIRYTNECQSVQELHAHEIVAMNLRARDLAPDFRSQKCVNPCGLIQTVEKISLFPSARWKRLMPTLSTPRIRPADSNRYPSPHYCVQ
jgi:hypothetical protein